MTEKLNSYVLAFTVFLLFCASYFPAFSGIVSKWAVSDDYSHAFLTVPVIIFMFWRKREIFIKGEGQGLTGLVLLVVSVGVYLVALRIQIPTMIFLATYLTIVSSIIYFAGFKAIVELFLPLLVLLLIIPIPPIILSTATASLQLQVSRMSEAIFHLTTIPLLREGNIIYIPGKIFQIVDACSGIRSLLAMTTLALIIGFFTLEKRWTVAVLFVCSCAVALLLNVFRVAALIFAFYYLKIDLTSGVNHTLLGTGLFLCGFAIIIIFKGFLKQWEKNDKSS